MTQRSMADHWLDRGLHDRWPDRGLLDVQYGPRFYVHVHAIQKDVYGDKMKYWIGGSMGGLTESTSTAGSSASRCTWGAPTTRNASAGIATCASTPSKHKMMDTIDDGWLDRWLDRGLQDRWPDRGLLDDCIVFASSRRRETVVSVDLIQKSVRDMIDVSLSFRAAGFLAVPRGKPRIARLLNFEYAIPNFEFSNLKFEI